MSLGFLHRQLLADPPAPQESFKGKTVIITGANGGLGLEATRTIAKLDASRIIMACRTVSKGEAAKKDIQSSTGCAATIHVWQLDMNSYKSIESFAERVNNELDRVDALLANAGVAKMSFKITEGHEETITTNVISTILLGLLLQPKLQATAMRYNTLTHFSVTSSDLHGMSKFPEKQAAPGHLFSAFDDPETFEGRERYNVSKLLEVFAVQQMAEMSPLEVNGVVMSTVAPG
jgi:NAD(P)-dependent dehydrogenase (short-subunit alcohol dehydrogenase family)